MSPREKARKYERDMKTYEGAKQAAARRGLTATSFRRDTGNLITLRLQI